MKILVIDGQGGKIGQMLVSKIKETYPGFEIIAIGTNALATAAMLKAGADAGATGENPVLVNAPLCDVIIGPIGILIADSLHGEITDSMAAAVAKSRAKKVIIPMENCSVYVAGLKDLGISEYINLAVKEAGSF